ncbi:MOZ/SAS family protein, partial [Ancylostoma caninum]
PFLFYVVTKNDDYGFHFVGYFSKEKYSQQKFNLSCIVTLPCYQKQGFGRFLIDFSFLLSRREHLSGTPERPLSDLGRISYASYWRTSLFEYIHEHVPKNSTKKLLLTDLAKGTGIAVHDIVEVFDALNWFQKQNGSIGLTFNWTMIDAHWKKARADKTRIWLNESALRWTPCVYTPSKDFGIRSPVISPASPNQSTSITSTPTGVSLAAVGSTIKKVFPGNYGQRSPPKAAAVTASPLPSAHRDVASSTVPHCDSPTTSVGTAATVPMRLGDAAMRCSPGGGRTLQDVEADDEVAAIVASTPPSNRPHLEHSATPPAIRSRAGSQTTTRQQQTKEGKSTTASSAETSEHSDVEPSHAPSESSRSASSCSSRGVAGVDSPRPLGDRIPDHEEAVNMGGVPDDDDGYSRCAPSEESDHPPQLQAEAAIAGSTGGGSSDEAPPRLHHNVQPPVGSATMGGPPPLHDGYNTDDDDAPPQLSPANIEPGTVPPREMTEEEKQQLAMDRPPKAPAMLDKVNDEENENIYTTMMPMQSMPAMEQQCSSVSSQQQVTTPLQQYPGSLKQTTPGSVPSCQMASQHTPEMQQQTFMSPVMQVWKHYSLNYFIII